MDLRLEVAVVPVSDVDRSKAFYTDQLGFHEDHDTDGAGGMRVVQLTPPGSACSIAIGSAGLSSMEPGTLSGLQLVTDDMDGTYAELAGRGVELSEVEALGRPGGPQFKFAHFGDPDGNRWILQEIPRPSRMVTGTDFVFVPVKDYDGAVEFYGTTLGLPRSVEYERMPGSEFETGNLTLVVMDAGALGMEPSPSRQAIALRVDDVAAARADLESRGVEFRGDTVDTGVCHQAYFSDPEGNALILHHRYAPR